LESPYLSVAFKQFFTKLAIDRRGYLQELKKTPLNQEHRTLGAKMVPFGGWEMPIQYNSILIEHNATREKAGLFDVSHMGEIFIEGDSKAILNLLEKNTCNTVGTIRPNAVQYNAVLNQSGGLVDDITLYKFTDNKFMICSNASNYEAVYNHLISQPESKGLSIQNQSSTWHQIAIQGPLSEEIFSKVLERSLNEIKYYTFLIQKYHSKEIIISRTGYTGEDGFEIYTDIETGLSLWKELLSAGQPLGLVPVGLGARDTLRLEAKYPLYGHELNAERTPVESGIGWIVKEKEIQYHAYNKIMSQKRNGSEYTITGIVLKEPGVLREAYPLFNDEGERIGITTSGSYSPSRKDSVALAFVKRGSISDGSGLFVEIRGTKKQCVFHTKGFITSKVKK
jgi:aminomethyltransferase